MENKNNDMFKDIRRLYGQLINCWYDNFNV